MTTAKQDREFGDAIIDTTALLQEAIAWIKKNMSPDEVFDASDLRIWARDNGFVLED